MVAASTNQGGDAGSAGARDDSVFSVRFGPLGPISGLAKRVPNFKKTGNALDDAQNMSKKANLQRLITILMAKDEYIGPTLDALETGLITLGGQSSAPEKESTHWHHSYKRWRKVPKYWKTEFLTKLGMGLTTEELNHMEFRDPDSINQMFDYILQFRPDDFFPAALLNKELCASVCYRRHDEVGKRSSGFKEKAIKDYRIDWVAGGVYSARLDEATPNGLVIIHQPTSSEVVIGGAATEAGAQIEIVKNWLDIDAELILPNGFRCKPSSLFKKGTGPWVHRLDDKASQLTLMATQCQAALSERMEQQSKTSMSQGSSALLLSKTLRKEEFKSNMAEKRKAAKQLAESTPSKRPRAVSLTIGQSPAASTSPLPAPLQDALVGATSVS